jgi:hypothetical protein
VWPFIPSGYSIALFSINQENKLKIKVEELIAKNETNESSKPNFKKKIICIMAWLLNMTRAEKEGYVIELYKQIIQIRYVRNR